MPEGKKDPHEALLTIFALIPEARRELREDPCGPGHRGCALRENIQTLLDSLQHCSEAYLHG